MSDEKERSGEKTSLLDDKTTSLDYGGTPVREAKTSATTTGSSYHSAYNLGSGHHSPRGSKHASFEQAAHHSASYEKIQSPNPFGEDGPTSCCMGNPRLLAAALLFFIMTSVVLAAVVGLMATRVVIIGSADATVRAESPSSSITNKAAAPKALPLLASVFDFEEHAQKVLDPNAWMYFSSGATEEITLRDNVAAYRRLRIRPNREVDVSTAATSLSIKTFGGSVSIPIGFSPTASHWWANKEGEIGTARAAQNLNTVMIVSIDASTLTADIQAAVPGALLWQQMFILGEKNDTRYLINNAEKSGCKAIVVTIDKPAAVIRYATLRGQIIRPEDFPPLANYPPNMADSSGYHKKRDWDEITWMTYQTSLPIIVKGVLTAFEAREAINHGASGIIVSNHGGRALDGVPATIDQLAEIVAEVKGQVPVYLDGGIRTGIDVFKALALGADMVFVGRPVIWGLVYDGQRGVEKVINTLTDELVNTMQLAGTANLTAIKPNYVYHQDTKSACDKV